MSRNDMPRSLAAQMLRATSLGGADKVNYDLIAKAVAAWEIKRGIGVICPIGKGSAEWLAVRTAARARLAAEFAAGNVEPDPVIETPAQKRSRQLARKRELNDVRAAKLARQKAGALERALEIMAHPERYSRLAVARARIEHARRTGGDAAVKAVQDQLRIEADARYNAKHRRRAKQSTNTNTNPTNNTK